ncbi:MAG: hypothetical protein P1V51_01705 [Deltaproteobacteria bacterium]|nr:hypothetical protein [Deltaproteobacteria bacterium]
MKNQKRNNRVWQLSGAIAVVLFSSGCIIHTYDHRDDFYETQSRTRTVYTTSYAYVGGHVIPDVHGGGWCFVTGQHHHGYAPDYPSYYGDAGGYYQYQGPVSFYFYGYHPIPAGHGHGWCNLHGRHVHRYHPGNRSGWQYHRSRRYYWYDDRSPRRDPHPAEPAWADRNPRGEPVRGTAMGPTGHAATPAPRGQPAPADDRHSNTRGQGHQPGHSNGVGHEPRANPAPVRRYGETPSYDLGTASDRGGTYIPATPAQPAATRADPRPTYGASGVTPAATRADPRPTYGATPVNEDRTAVPARPNYGAQPVPPSATRADPRPTFGATPVDQSRSPVSQPGNRVDPRWRQPQDPTGGTATTPARSGGVRHLGPAKAERAKQGDKDEREAQGLKKKKESPAKGAKIRLEPATPAKGN